MSLAARLLHPSSLVLIAANALPLLGVLVWHWDAFQLLMLYWLETLIIGFWTILAIAISPREAIGPSADQTSRIFLVPFFMVHSGIFMSVHFMFLWDLFGGAEARAIHGVREFISVIVIGKGLWVALAAMFVSHGMMFAVRMWGDTVLPAWLVPARTEPADESPFARGRALYNFYGRIVTMHLAVLFGAMLAIAFGAIGPLLLLVALKTAADLAFHLKNDFPAPRPVVMRAS